MIDHLVLATPDIEATATWLADATGVMASVGGPHVGRGTRNMLCSFGDDRYLEIIGPDSEQPEPDRPRRFGIDGLAGARLVTWCARPADIAAHVALAASEGLTYTDPTPMARQAPTGLLEWTLSHPTFDTMNGIVPFCIDWGTTPHPSTVAAPGLSLTGLRAQHPNPGDAAGTLAKLGLGLMIDEAATPSLRARVEGPAGAIELPHA